VVEQGRDMQKLDLDKFNQESDLVLSSPPNQLLHIPHSQVHCSWLLLLASILFLLFKHASFDFFPRVNLTRCQQSSFSSLCLPTSSKTLISFAISNIESAQPYLHNVSSINVTSSYLDRISTLSVTNLPSSSLKLTARLITRS